MTMKTHLIRKSSMSNVAESNFIRLARPIALSEVVCRKRASNVARPVSFTTRSATDFCPSDVPSVHSILTISEQLVLFSKLGLEVLRRRIRQVRLSV